MSYLNKMLWATLTVGYVPIGSYTAGFIEDSHARLDTRNLYFNQDFRDGINNPSRAEEWGQGFLFDFTSGYTQGMIGFGIDAIGMMGIKLDSGKGTHYNPQSINRSGQLFPTGNDGRAVDTFSTLGLTAKVKVANTELKWGTLRPRLPVLVFNDGRLLPETFQGVHVTSKDFDNVTLTGGQISRVKSRNSSNDEGMAISGAGGAVGQRSNEFNFAGVEYGVTKALTVQYYFATLKDFYRQHFIGAVHNWTLPVGSLKSDLRFFDSGSSGKNDSTAGRAEGYRGSGFDNRGKVDNQTSSALFTYSLKGHAIGVGYQYLSGDSDFPFVNQQDGSATYLITDRQSGARFQKAGERTWVAQYNVDFATYGLPGLSTLLAYQRGSNIMTAAGDKQELERNFWVSYAIQTPALKGLAVSWRNASLRSTFPAQRNVDENRLYITYTLPIF